jgi:hypothetical protein
MLDPQEGKKDKKWETPGGSFHGIGKNHLLNQKAT